MGNLELRSKAGRLRRVKPPDKHGRVLAIGTGVIAGASAFVSLLTDLLSHGSPSKGVVPVAVLLAFLFVVAAEFPRLQQESLFRWARLALGAAATGVAIAPLVRGGDVEVAVGIGCVIAIFSSAVIGVASPQLRSPILEKAEPDEGGQLLPGETQEAPGSPGTDRLNVVEPAREKPVEKPDRPQR